jgi:hypothetical protein
MEWNRTEFSEFPNESNGLKVRVSQSSHAYIGKVKTDVDFIVEKGLVFAVKESFKVQNSLLFANA